MTARILPCLFAGFAAVVSAAHGGFEPPGTARLTPAADAAADLRPLRSAAPAGVGPLALPFLHHSLLGTAHVFGSVQPDVFIAGSGKQSALFLFRWLRNTPDGVPVFAPPQPVESPFSDNGAIFQTTDGVVHGLWLHQRTLVHTRFDRRAGAFQRVGEVALTGLPSAPQSVAAFPNADGSVELVFEVNGFSIPARQKETNPSSDDWRPYDAAGIATAAMRYRYLFAARAPALLSSPLDGWRRLSATDREVYWGMGQITPVNLGRGHERGIMTGSRMGVLNYYAGESADGRLAVGRRMLAAGEDGNALRHPSIGPSVFAYPETRGGVSHLLAGGEGAVYFYRFTGRFTAAGAPIFQTPVPALQENADLYAGTLPAPCVADWDGDGVQDIVVGNSEGFVLFCKNIGTDDSPAFLPGERICAGGREIQIQAGYSGSVQGVQEARWGYVSPTVVDWNGDGLPDVVLGDVTGNYTICLNRGTKTAPALEAARPLYCDGLDLHGMWRSRAAIGTMGGRLALAIVDGDDNFHLYWRIDDFNVADGGKLTLADGSLISASAEPGGGTGRCKLDFYDADGDGKLDLVIGTGRRSAIPNKTTGYPLPVLKRTLGAPLFMRNAGTDARPVFEHPMPFFHGAAGLVQPGGAHETGAVATRLGGGGVNLLVANEVGRLFLLRGRNLKLLTPAEAAPYAGKRNPFPSAAGR